MNISKSIRINARNNYKSIIEHLGHYYVNRENGEAKARPIQRICVFCGAGNNITGEHVLSRWVFEKAPNRFFNTTINGLSHKYNETTVPACATCNNHLLSALERRVLQLFRQHKGTENFFHKEEAGAIMRWMEILDYKYQVFSLITRFKAYRGKGVVQYSSDYSLSILDPNIEYSPARAMQNLRKALYRVTEKSKDKKLNSLVTLKTKNSDMHFFHKNNDFLFLELPRYNLALLHFFERTFINVIESKDAAMDVIKKHY